MPAPEPSPASSPVPVAPTMKELAARLNADVLPLAQARLDALGEEESGFYNFYAARIRDGSLFASYEVELAEAILALPDVPAVVHEVGGGLGTLSWLLAAAGLDVLCMEHDRRRIEAAAALLDGIADRWPDLVARCRLVRSSFPDAELDPAGATLVITNLIYTTTPAKRASLVAAIARYPQAIVDIDRFCEPARNEAERAAVLAQFTGAGMPTEPFLEVGKSANLHRMAGRARIGAVRTGGSPIVPDHGEILRRRGVDRIVYFHTDHFEPWRDDPGLTGADAFAASLDRVVRYSERVSERYYARRLTLHYLPKLAFQGRGDMASMLHVEGDGIGIIRRTAEQDAAAAAAFAAMDPRQDFDLQVHFHHEALTYNTHYAQRKSLRRHHRENDVAVNRLRFDLGLAECLRRVRNDTGRALPQWFFVHGVWALNASDPEVCSITDEISRLKAAGGLGDFTFPAGRPHCDPSFDRPALVRPFDAVKCYARDRADPRAPGTIDPADRFFIWSSRVSHGDCSLDFFSEGVAANFRNIDAWASRLLLNGYQRGSTLYVKTHAHSVFPFYFTEESGRPAGMFPHERDEVARLIECFEDAAAAVGGHVAYLQASEVYAELMRPPEPQAVDGYVETSLTFPRAAIDRADATGLTVLRERIAGTGAEAAALAGHYEMLVARERIILPAEIEIANLVERMVPRDMTIVHHRSAAGILSNALASGGRRVRSVERSRKRVEVQQEIARRLGSRLHVSHGRLEALKPGVLRGRALLLVDAGSPLDTVQMDAVISSFDTADLVILDVLRFGGRRQAAEIGPIVARLKSVDGRPAEPILDLGDDGKFYLIDNRSVKRPWWWRLFR
ncbi:hypothetical protein [Sphingomonas sp. ID0503]|uniref:hypothetical protein n=1 Tax=Sphingomonas sp. ID0503 TaxID=3399691 RepID=UPI003AFA76BD